MAFGIESATGSTCPIIMVLANPFDGYAIAQKMYAALLLAVPITFNYLVGEVSHHHHAKFVRDHLATNIWKQIL